MVGSRRPLLAGLTLGALLAGAVAPPAWAGLTADTGTHEIGHAVFRGSVKGILFVRPRGNTRTKMILSLHGLRPETAYDVIGSTRPCGKSLTNASRLFGLDVHASSATDVFQGLTLNFPSTRLRSMRSVRLIGDALDHTPIKTQCAVPELEEVSF